MNRKRSLRKLCMALCASLLFAYGAFVPQTIAYAAGNLDVVGGLTLNPASLPASGGTVTLSGVLKNNTDAAITTVTLGVDDHQLEINETIAAGASRSFSMSGVTISAGDIGREKTLTIDWAGSGTPASGTNTATFTVPLRAETVSLEFTRTANNTAVQMGDTVKLTYNFKNTGTAVITNLTLTDSCVEGTILSGLTLNPGESHTKTSSVVVNAEISSVPKAEYTAAGSTKSKTLEALLIKLAAAELSVTATVDKTQLTSGDTVTFSIVITNNSPVAVSGINVTDDLGTIVKSGANIAATTGSTPKLLNITYPVAMTAGRTVSFTITYPSGTSSATKTSTPIAITVLQAGSPLTLDVSASPIAMMFPGDVTFTITVTNISGQAISNINVKETALGDFGSIISLAPGGTQTLKKVSRLTQAGAFTFTATGTDALGAAIMAATKQISVTSQVGTQTPQVVSPSSSDTLHTLFVIMIVIIVLIVIAGIVLAILIILEKRKGGPKGGGSSKRRRNAVDWEEDSDDEDLQIATKRDQTRIQPDSNRRYSSIEHTQPILRSAIATDAAQGVRTPGRRRAYTLGADKENLPRHGIIEEEQSRVYGPLANPNEPSASPDSSEDAKQRVLRRPDMLEDRAPLRRSRLHDEEHNASLDQRYDSDLSTPQGHRRPPMPDEGEKPQVHLRYENEDDDLPPLRPRRRR